MNSLTIMISFVISNYTFYLKMIDFNSNLSRIRPKLRTTGRVSGNFGRNKVRAGSSLQSLGMTNAKDISITSQVEYVQRMYEAYDKADTPRMREFIYQQLRDIHIKSGQWCDS